jgi:hypothetical protein
LELDLNKGRYDIEVNTPSDVWLEPDWNWTQEKLVRPYTLNATFTPNAPPPGQGKVPSSAGAFDKTVVSNGVVNHYYKNGYLTVQPSGEASWYSYGTGNAIGVIEISAVPLPFEIPPDYAGNSPDMARDIGTLIGTQTFHDVIDRNDRFDYYKFNITSESKVDFALSGKMGNTGFYLFQDWYFNSDDSTHIDRISGTPPGVVPEFSETLKPGTYYVLVHKPKDYDGDEYDLKLSATPLGDPDGNYSIQTAQYLAPSPADFGDGIDHKAAEGSIGGNLDREDYYRFTLDKISDVDIQLSGDNPNAKFYLAKDLNGNGKLDYGEALQAVSNGSIKNISHSLGAGTYYVVVSSDDTVNQTNYSLKVDTQPEKAGNYPSQALDIGLLNGNKTFQGLVDTKEDTYDYYRFNLNETSNVSFKLDKLIAESSIHTQGINPIVTVELISANNEILASARGDSSSAASINRLLEPGAYYIRVNSTDTTGYASYELNLGGEVVYKKPNESPSLDKTVGYDGTNTHQTYVNTFTKNGGSSALGSPTGNVHPLVDNGYVQEFSGGSEGSGAIMKSGANDNSYWVGGAFWDKYKEEVSKGTNLGYPTSDRYQFSGGWKQDFQGGSLSTAPSAGGGSNNGGGNNTGSNNKLPQSASEAQAFFKNQFHQDPGLPAPPSNNCGPASLAIVLKALGLEPSGIGEQASINRAAELMGLNPTTHPDASDVDIEHGIQNAGGTWIDVGIGSTDQRWNTLNEALANQNPVIAFGNANPAWWSQIGYTNPRSVNHVIAILGKTSNGNYIVADPLSKGVVEVPQSTLSKFFNIYDNAPAGRAFVLPKSTEASETNPSQTSPYSNPQPTSGSSNSSQTALFTTGIVFQMFPNLGYVQTNIERYLPLILNELEKVGLGDREMVLMALATIRAETESFAPIDEGSSLYNTSPGGRPFNLYDFRSDLGNNGVGEGDRYKGRGFIQLTGKNNYQELGPQLGLGNQLVNNPELANDPTIAAQLLARFIKNKENAIRQALVPPPNYAKARRLVNGGSNGLDKFIDAFTKGASLTA